MKYSLMYAAVAYVIACADDSHDSQDHTPLQRLARAALWPLTLTSWFRSGNQRLHKLLTILWTCLVLGWALSLMSDRL